MLPLASPKQRQTLLLYCHDPEQRCTDAINEWISDSAHFLVQLQQLGQPITTPIQAPTQHPAVLLFVLAEDDVASQLSVVSQLSASAQAPPIIVIDGSQRTGFDKLIVRSGASDFLATTDLTVEHLDLSVRWVTDRMRAREVIHAKEKRFKTFFDNSPLAMFALDENWRFTDYNQSFLDLAAIPEQTLQQLALRDWVEPANQLEVIDNELECEGRIAGFRTRMRIDNQAVKEVRLTLSKVGQRETGHLLGSIEDITLIQKAERELQIAEKLSLTARLTRTIAHEVRNPLTNINLALEELSDLLPADHEGQLYLDMVSRNSERIAKQVNTLLNSARPQELKLESKPVNEVIEAAVTLMDDRLTLKEVALQLDLASNLQPIECDPKQLQVALVNLLTNAIEAMENTQKRSIAIASQANQEGRVAISIRDTGAGMDAETLQRLFDPFYSRKPKGMGLGMTTTRNIIKSHQGEIVADSTPGEGTIFHITL